MSARPLDGRRLSRLPPSGMPIPAHSLRRTWRERDCASLALATLRSRLEVEGVSLHASGREALRVALRLFSGRSSRSEVVLPAYTCFSVPSAVVAAGLRVRLVDVDDAARIDLADLAASPLDSAAAVVVCNLFGIPEPVAPVMECIASSGTAVVDDAAQSLGARAEDGCVGGRGDVGVLSFGRGKPVSALGGGALAWRRPPEDLEPVPVPEAGRFGALLRALSFRVALSPLVFRALAGIPALGIGETRFDPGFARGSISPAALFLLASQLTAASGQAQQRSLRARELAARIRDLGRWRPLLAPEEQHPPYPRLAVLAPNAGARDRALQELTRLGAGASRMYPASLDRVPALREHLAELRDCPVARDLAERVLTLPTHGGLAGERLERALDVLRRS